MGKTLKKSVSIIVPTYNEEGSVENLIKRVHKTLSKRNIKYEIIFIDDHSTDSTLSAISAMAMFYPVSYFLKQGKKGKSYSIYEGMRHAKYESVAMIDADLQYPPEALPEMIEKLNTADIVVTNRKNYQDSVSRRVFSRVFRFVFGSTLFNLKHDIQSGLKLFKKEVVDSVKFDPTSPWTFDLEFLHRAKEAGFKIVNQNITFAPRVNGESKMNFVKQTLEIGINAIRVRAKKIEPIHFAPTGQAMVGAGIGYKQRKYTTHTTIKHDASALTTFTLAQKIISGLIILDVLLGLYINTKLTLQIVVATLSSIYFADVLFNMYLIGKSLAHPQEITSTKSEIARLNDRDLPIYTILCPLYKEAHVIPQFMSAIEKISWPKKKLDVILLLEADDQESIEAVKKMSLPSYVRTLIVPDSAPKTKPKACNYGLSHAKGEYLVIYDAEDMPDPLQLKKAYVAFSKVSAETICLQAKLNYYNPNQNLLTRFFTAEYSLWFDVTLTGLQSVDTTIPLGGTSNHFKIESLRAVEGWDPFNVTEDADLGVRLFKKGFKTAIIDSVTLEEANSRFGNWLRQRSRWIKGYMQTYLVHTRPSESRMTQKHSLMFQLLIGGKIAFVLINPFLWLATIAYFALYAYVGPQIEALYPSAVFYMAVFSLVFGNFMFLYYYMIGVAKKGQWSLMKYVYLIPIYWIMISISAFIALYQLLFKPHYWEKTVHGLHLLKTKPQVVAAKPEKKVDEQPRKTFGWIDIPALPSISVRSVAAAPVRAVYVVGNFGWRTFEKPLKFAMSVLI
ncbi:MAG TPA: glycosyltransferase [Patescibacteria group bacterium]|nr:glycosyltransferase [Patescibacteria group bacterium]